MKISTNALRLHIASIIIVKRNRELILKKSSAGIRIFLINFPVKWREMCK